MFQLMLSAGCILCLVILTGCASGTSRKIVFLSDTDHDGVVGQLDRCPGTPAGIAVDSNGCAADTDGDGVFDAFDRCPATTVRQVVDLHGCNLDRDADGVFDWRDKCLQSLAGVPVNLNGCSADSYVAGTRFENHRVDPKFIVYFDVNRSTIPPDFEPLLLSLAAGLDAGRVEQILISGHADSFGSEGYNSELGNLRAHRVAALLAAQAPQLASRLALQSLGESDPLRDNASAMGRLLNRRVEIRVRQKGPTQAAGLSAQ